MSRASSYFAKVAWNIVRGLETAGKASIAAVFLAVCLSSVAAAANDPCRAWKEEIKTSSAYVAKVTFHRIDVAFDGEILHNVRDEKEVREGEHVRFGDIECEERSVDLEVRSLERGVKTRVRLLLSQAERASKGAPAIQELLEVVLERKER